MKNYKHEHEKKVRSEFVLYLESYGVRAGLELAESLRFQSECYRRFLEREVKARTSKKKVA